MRDDLHRTVAAPRHWKRLVQMAARESERPKLPEALRDATLKTLSREIRPEMISRLRDFASTASADMFGAEQVHEFVADLQSRSKSPVERDVCETFRSLVAISGVTPEIVDHAVRDVAKETANHECEGLIAQARNSSVWAARELRHELNRGLQHCDFENICDDSGAVVRPKKRAPKAAIDLDESISRHVPK